MKKQMPGGYVAGGKQPKEGEPRNSVSEDPRAIHTARPVQVDLARHRLRCKVCTHPKRDTIEQDFLRWRSPEKLARDYNIADHSSIYRHVHATGLYARRRQSTYAALEAILERSGKAHSSDFDAVRAASAYAHMDSSGQRVDPPTQFIFKLVEGSEFTSALHGPRAARPKQAQSNSQTKESKNDATH